MKTFIFSLFLSLLCVSGFAQPIPQDSLYLGQSKPGNTPVIFQLHSSSGLRPVERISISSDNKEIYYSELDNWPANVSRVKCYKYVNNMWQGPFVVFEGFIAPGLSVNDSTLYMQKDTNGIACTFYSTRTASGWSTPKKLLTSNLQSHYFQETQLKNCYLASSPNSNSDICRLVINNQDSTIQSLGIPINSSVTENDFFIARDESYIIFFRLSSPYNLFISFHKTNGKWTNPKAFGPNINTNIYDCCPFVTSDNKYLFFTRGNWPMSTYFTYWVKVDNIIDSLKNSNYIPYLANQIPIQRDTVNVPYNFVIPDSTFIDDDGNNSLAYSAVLSNGNPLPSWLNFNPQSKTFSGTPPSVGTFSLRVTVTDIDSAKAHCFFDLVVVQQTAINIANEKVANQYKLFQNFPNPFNPSTVIGYSLPKSGFVNIKVYNIIGKEITTLVNSFQNTGYHEINFNSNNLNLSSGIYIYTISAIDVNSKIVFRDSKFMNFIK